MCSWFVEIHHFDFQQDLVKAKKKTTRVAFSEYRGKLVIGRFKDEFGYSAVPGGVWAPP